MSVSVRVTSPIVGDIAPARWPAGPAAPIEADPRWLNAMRSRMGDSGVLFEAVDGGATVLAAYGNVTGSAEEYEAYNLGRILAVGAPVFPLTEHGVAERARIAGAVAPDTWYPSLVVTLPGYRCGIVGPARHDAAVLGAVVDAIVRWSADAGCAAVGLLYLDEADACVRDVAADRGAVPAPLTTRSTLRVTWDDFAGYTGTLPPHRRSRVRQERSTLRRAGVSAGAVPIADVEGEVVAMRCAALRRYGQAADAGAERERLRRLRAAVGDEGVTTFVASQGECPGAFALFVSGGDRALCVWSGARPASAGTGAHFAAAYYAPIEHWAGTPTTLDYGIGHPRAKRLRGCVPTRVDAALLAVDPRLTEPIAALGRVMREHISDDE